MEERREHDIMFSHLDEENSDKPDDAKLPLLGRSNRNVILAGVCGGIAEYLKIDPLIVRLVFILSLLLGYWAVVAYFIAALLLPRKKSDASASMDENYFRKMNLRTTAGLGFVLLGSYLIFDYFNLLENFFIFSFLRGIFLPLVFIGAGILVLLKKKYYSKNSTLNKSSKLYKSQRDKRVSGVCRGLADYLNYDVAVIRLLWILFIFCTAGIGILIYLLFTFSLQSVDLAVGDNE